LMKQLVKNLKLMVRELKAIGVRTQGREASDNSCHV
jgi:hypothetical protein